MRLRETIRPPQRYDNEDFITPQRSLRQARRQARPSSVAFNPNLPPAAFPSLERPRPGNLERPGQSQGQHQRSETENGENDRETRDDFEDMPMDEIENTIASNGELNPTYVKNMAMMASSVDNPYEDMEDSDPDEAMADSDSPAPDSAPPMYDPQWSELSRKMQVEILNNLLQNHCFLGVCHMLGLSTKERVAVQEQFDLPNNQIELENKELEEMRAKQVRALMRIDNSALKQHKVPHKLVFRKISRQCARRLRETIEMDYLLCQSGELLAARRFLQRRGIDRRYAGDWGNDMVTLRAPENSSELETFEWKENQASMPYSTGETVVATYTPAPSKERQPGLSLAELLRRESFINNIGEAPYSDPQELIMRRGNPLASPKRFAEYRSRIYKERLENLKRDHARAVASQSSGLLCLKIGPERAAHIQSAERLYIGQEDMFQPSCGTLYRNKPTESMKEIFLAKYAMVNRPVFPNADAVITGPPGLMRPPPITTTQPVLSLPAEPVLRAVGGAWSYNSIDNNLMPNSGYYFRTRKALETIMMEQEQQRIAQAASAAEDDDDTISSATFDALAREFLNLESGAEPDDFSASPMHAGALIGVEPEDSPAPPSVQGQASGDPRQSLPTATSASHRSGEERAGEDMDDNNLNES